MYKDMDRLTAFNKGLNSWASWVDQNVNPSKTKVFFQGISPTPLSVSLNHHFIIVSDLLIGLESKNKK